MPTRWHHHVPPAAASLTAPRRCVVGLTKSVGAQLGMKVSKVGITNQRRSFFLQIVALYGRLLRASVWRERTRSPLVCILHWVFYRSPKCAHQHQLSIETRWFIDIAMFNPISSRAICSAQNTKESRKHAPNSKTLQVILDVMVEPYGLSIWKVTSGSNLPPQKKLGIGGYGETSATIISPKNKSNDTCPLIPFFPSNIERKLQTRFWSVRCFWNSNSATCSWEWSCHWTKGIRKPRDSPQWSKSLVCQSKDWGFGTKKSEK